MDDRASGRNRSEIDALKSRFKGLLEASRALAAPSLASDDRAYGFVLEGLAWTLVQTLRARLFRERPESLAPTKGTANDADLFPAFTRLGILDLVEARMLRQFCEYRWLSSRDPAAIDFPAIRDATADLEWLESLYLKLV